MMETKKESAAEGVAVQRPAGCPRCHCIGPTLCHAAIVREREERIAKLERALSSTMKAAGSASQMTNRLQFIYERTRVALAGERWDESFKAQFGYKMRNDEISERDKTIKALREQVAGLRKDAAMAWSVCTSIHREYAKSKDPFFKTRQADFIKHEENARAAIAGESK